jgi:hypothetical protein
MTHIYRVRVGRAKPQYFGDRPSTDQHAQALADRANETVTIEHCQLIDLSPTTIAVRLLNGGEWCAAHRVLRYVKPRPQQRVA